LEATTPNAWTGTTGPAIIIFRTWLIWALARLGRHTDAHAEASRMRGLAEEADLPLGKTLAHLSEGFALAHAGHLPEAEATLRTSLALCRKWELFAWSTNILSCLGHVLSRLGRFEEAFDLIGQATERTVRSGILVNHAHELSWLAETHRLAGNPQLAVRNADRAVEVARRHEERGNEALASFVLGEAWSDLGALSAGRECFETALAIAIESGMAPLVEQCRARLSSLAPASPPLQHEPERKTNVR
jgi:tetratricopeptide (TPR) repeat protein